MGVVVYLYIFVCEQMFRKWCLYETPMLQLIIGDI